MKNKKVLFVLLNIMILLFLNSNMLYSVVGREVYNKTNVIIYSIMLWAIPVVIIAYIIFTIIYFIKSKKDVKIKLKNLSILFLAVIILSVFLFLGACLVFDLGKTYTSIPINLIN